MDDPPRKPATTPSPFPAMMRSASMSMYDAGRFPDIDPPLDYAGTQVDRVIAYVHGIEEENKRLRLVIERAEATLGWVNTEKCRAMAQDCRAALAATEPTP